MTLGISVTAFAEAAGQANAFIGRACGTGGGAPTVGGGSIIGALMALYQGLGWPGLSLRRSPATLEAGSGKGRMSVTIVLWCRGTRNV